MSARPIELLRSNHNQVRSGPFADVRADSLLIGESAAMVAVRRLIARIARSPLPVLIVGPTGSGKELVARAVHRASQRSGKLVALNVAAVAGSMFEDLLFGHVRGAFTGAVAAHRGYISDADRGTLFLDEIGTLGLNEQAKLLRALETKTVRPVGGANDVPSDFRLVTATNADLEQHVRDGQFRADLFYRVRGITIALPSLRERLEDVTPLFEHFVHQAAVHMGDLVRVLPGVVSELRRHEWPGNVRELRSMAERLVYESQDGYITRRMVCELLDDAVKTVDDVRVAEGLVQRCELIDALERHAWKAESAARELGWSRATIYRRMREQQVKRPRR